MIRQQPDITIPEMAEALGKSTRAIEMQLAKLRNSGKLQRVGPAKGGRWEIIGGDEK
jgi:ATP-dependent DNA helicase RecG